MPANEGPGAQRQARTMGRTGTVEIEQGPLLGKLLAAIAEGQYCGSVTDEQSAVELARTLLASGD